MLPLPVFGFSLWSVGFCSVLDLFYAPPFIFERKPTLLTFPHSPSYTKAFIIRIAQYT